MPESLIVMEPADLFVERDVVLHRPHGGDTEEVKERRRVFDGAQITTQTNGRARLQWPDLWVFLYRTTKLEMESCNVGTDLCFALDLGTAMLNDESKADQRVVWATDNSRIELRGTAVMIAYHPGKDITVVRVFDGTALVTNTKSTELTATVATRGEWVQVAGDATPVVSSDGSALQELASELDMRDGFAEIEQRMRSGFGPKTAGLRPEEVALWFSNDAREGAANNAGSLPLREVMNPPGGSDKWSEAMDCTPAARQPKNWEEMTNNATEIWSAQLRNGVSLDGGISSVQEWSDANCYDLVLGNPGTEFITLRSRWWVKNDAESLYLLARLPAGAADEAWIGYFWPHPYTGQWKHSDEGGVGLRGTLFDRHGWDEREWSDDVKAAPPGRNDVQGLASSDATYTWFEFRKALNSGDGYDWDWSPRGTVGTEGDLLLGVWDAANQTAPRSYITLVLGTERIGASAVAQPSPTPTPTTAPTVARCALGVLYCEDFEDGLAQDWTFTDQYGRPTSSGWRLTSEGGNHLIAGSEHNWAVLSDHSWEDYRVRFRLKLTRGVIHLNYRLAGGGRYFFGFDQNGLSLNWQRGDTFSEGSVVWVEAPHALNDWHQVEIVGRGGHLQMYVDGRLELDHTDDEPLRRGSIGFETLDNSAALIDDIVVMPSGSAPIMECRVVASTLNIRQGPGTNYPTVGASLSRGTRLTPLGRNNDGSWVSVRVGGSGREGWVNASSQYVSCNQLITRLAIHDVPAAPKPPEPSAAKSPQPPKPATPQPPSIVCRPQTTTIEAGQSATLSWDVEGAQAVYFEGEGVGGHDRREVSPGETRTYTLRVVSRYGEEYCRMTVEVQALPRVDTEGPQLIGLETLPSDELIRLSCGETGELIVVARLSDPSGVRDARLITNTWWSPDETTLREDTDMERVDDQTFIGRRQITRTCTVDFWIEARDFADNGWTSDKYTRHIRSLCIVE
jgi:hypothetical protein